MDENNNFPMTTTMLDSPKKALLSPGKPASIRKKNFSNLKLNLSHPTHAFNHSQTSISSPGLVTRTPLPAKASTDPYTPSARSGAHGQSFNYFHHDKDTLPGQRAPHTTTGELHHPDRFLLQGRMTSSMTATSTSTSASLSSSSSSSARSFSDRHSITKLTPILFVGSLKNLTDEAYFEQHNIKSVISVINVLSTDEEYYKAFEASNRVASENHLKIFLNDNSDTNIKKYFAESNKFINERKGAGGVYIHCHLGVSRSVTLCLAYLLQERIVENLEEGLKFIQNRRPIAYPNFGFLSQLKTFQNELLSEQTKLDSGVDLEISEIKNCEAEASFVPAIENCKI